MYPSGFLQKLDFGYLGYVVVGMFVAARAVSYPVRKRDRCAFKGKAHSAAVIAMVGARDLR